MKYQGKYLIPGGFLDENLRTNFILEKRGYVHQNVDKHRSQPRFGERSDSNHAPASVVSPAAGGSTSKVLALTQN